MIIALALLGYAACVAWCAPALLAPLTRGGRCVRAGLAAWLAAMTSVLVSAAFAVALSVGTATVDWPRLTQALCRSVAGGACTPAVYRSVLYQGGVTVLAVLLLLALLAAAWRYGRRVQRSRAQTRAHAQAALLVGRAMTGPRPAASDTSAAAAGRPGNTPVGRADAVGPEDTAVDLRTAAPGGARTVVLDDPRPAAYCVAGRPAAIVVTSGALAVLDPPQLQAVLAHEDAHLAHGHHVLVTVTRGLAAAFPGVPLFTRGPAEMARLTEMAADDEAARASGRSALIAALLAIATGRAVTTGDFPGAGLLSADSPGSRPQGGPGPVPARALAAATQEVPARVERLLGPPQPVAAIIGATMLTALSAVLAAAPPLLALLLR